MEEKGRALLDASLAVLVDRAGGAIELTQTEYVSIKARRGPYRIVAMVDKTGPGEPVIRISLKPTRGAPSDPVM